MHNNEVELCTKYEYCNLKNMEVMHIFYKWGGKVGWGRVWVGMKDRRGTMCIIKRLTCVPNINAVT